MWRTKTPARYDSVDLDTLVESSEPTVFFSPTLQQQSVFAEVGRSKKPEIEEEGELSQDLSDVVSRGADFSRLVKHRPDDIIPTLRDLAVTKIGEFQSNDPELLNAFRNKKMLTYAFDDVYIPEYETTWKGILRYEGQKHLSDDGWHENMTLVVYCVNIKHAAGVLGDGILRPLLLKAETGEEDDAVWDFPCVRAVIEFKWTHWARRYLIAEFLLYLGWLLCFVGFMTIYIEKNLDKSFYHHMDGEDKTFAFLAYALDAGSLWFMCPFLVIEYNTINFYRSQWLSMWNILDSLAYVLQLLVSILHFTHAKFQSKFYVSLLAAHCTLLFIKVQYFARVMGPRASYVETLKTLIYNVRYFLLFIVLSMISAALSLAVLYKWEIDRKEGEKGFNESLGDFESLPRSIVTAYSILLGNFESAYIFDTDNRFVKGVFFLFFQLFMSITILNLLIAVMTESYGKTTKKENIEYNRGKAQLVDELELSLPKILYPQFKCYVHFVVCEKRRRLRYELSTLASQVPSSHSFEDEIRNELRELKNMIAELKQGTVPQSSTKE